MNNKIIMIGLLLSALNANAQNINNCDSTCFGNPFGTIGVQQNTNSSQTNYGQFTYVAPDPETPAPQPYRMWTYHGFGFYVETRNFPNDPCWGVSVPVPIQYGITCVWDDGTHIRTQI